MEWWPEALSAEFQNDDDTVRCPRLVRVVCGQARDISLITVSLGSGHFTVLDT